jgi:hypothetical protein
MSDRSRWPASRLVIAVAWASDLIWAAMVCFGNSAVTEAGLWGFGVSTVVFFIAKAKYDSWKAAAG